MPRYANPDEQISDYSAFALLRDVWRFTRPYRLRLVLISIITASKELASLYPIYAFASIVTLLTNEPTAHTAEITRILVLLISSVLWQFIANYVIHVHGSYLNEQMGAGIELRSLRHLFKIDIAWHEKENSGNKLRRINNGTSGVQQIVRLWFNSLIQIIITMVGTIYIVGRFNVFTAAAIAVFIVIHYLLSYTLTKKAARSAHAANLESEVVNGLTMQAVSNIRTVKVMGLAEPLHSRITEAVTNLYNKTRRRIFLFEVRGTTLSLWGQFVRHATLIYIIFGVVRGQYEIGFLVLFNGYFTTIRDLASRLSGLGESIAIARYSVGRLQELLNLPTPIEDSNNKEVFPREWKQLNIQNLNFSYEQNQVLRDISFQVKRGEKVGIIGLSGAGKSTLFKLLLKEYESFSGSISFDNTPIERIKMRDYFSHVAVVLQDTEVFNFSLKENITLSNDAQKGNTALLERSLEIAHVADFLPKLPEGVNTLIGEKGVKLSGGEKQRLGIARAVFKEPQILLLDEATSHLDIESEAKIKDSLHQFFESVTAIVIAHRLTTIKEMDKILVIEEGRLVEQGTFEELYEQQGRFFELWEKQKL